MIAVAFWMSSMYPSTDGAVLASIAAVIFTGLVANLIVVQVGGRKGQSGEAIGEEGPCISGMFQDCSPHHVAGWRHGRSSKGERNAGLHEINERQRHHTATPHPKLSHNPLLPRLPMPPRHPATPLLPSPFPPFAVCAVGSDVAGHTSGAHTLVYTFPLPVGDEPVRIPGGDHRRSGCVPRGCRGERKVGRWKEREGGQLRGVGAAVMLFEKRLFLQRCGSIVYAWRSLHPHKGLTIAKLHAPGNGALQAASPQCSFKLPVKNVKYLLSCMAQALAHPDSAPSTLFHPPRAQRSDIREAA